MQHPLRTFCFFCFHGLASFCSRGCCSPASSPAGAVHLACFAAGAVEPSPPPSSSSSSIIYNSASRNKGSNNLSKWVAANGLLLQSCFRQQCIVMLGNADSTAWAPKESHLQQELRLAGGASNKPDTLQEHPTLPMQPKCRFACVMHNGTQHRVIETHAHTHTHIHTRGWPTETEADRESGTDEQKQQERCEPHSTSANSCKTSCRSA